MKFKTIKFSSDLQRKKKNITVLQENELIRLINNDTLTCHDNKTPKTHWTYM